MFSHMISWCAATAGTKADWVMSAQRRGAIADPAGVAAVAFTRAANGATRLEQIRLDRRDGRKRRRRIDGIKHYTSPRYWLRRSSPQNRLLIVRDTMNAAR